MDLHRSNPFGTFTSLSDDIDTPEAWYVLFLLCHCMYKNIFIRLSNDAKHESSLLYTRRRDIHSVGIVFLQMLLGLDVMQKFDDVHEALRSCTSTNPLLYFMVLIPMRP